MDPASLIKAVRRRHGLTQADLARLAGTSQPVISAYEHRRRDPSYETLRRLVEAGGERLRLEAAAPESDVPAARDLRDHGRRLLDVLSLVDAIPARRRSTVLVAPPARLELSILSRPTLAERVLAIHAALSKVPHAFGGALALAYYAEPRATVDIDLNVFVPAEQFPTVAGALGKLGATADTPAIAALVQRDGQARVMWDQTPIDLFFSYDAFHDAAAAARVVVPFGNKTIPILGASHLIVCKAVFNRPKDWIDIESILSGGTQIDVAEVLRWVGRIARDEDPRYNRVVALLTRG